MTSGRWCWWWPGGVTRDCEWILTLAGVAGDGRGWLGAWADLHPTFRFSCNCLVAWEEGSWQCLHNADLLLQCCSLAPLGQIMDSREECPEHCAVHLPTLNTLTHGPRYSAVTHLDGEVWWVEAVAARLLIMPRLCQRPANNSSAYK